MEQVHVEGSPTRCPFCKGELENLKEIVACAACGARHHGSCHAENSARCATCGSREVLLSKAAPRALSEPPAGSKILVVHSGDSTVYSWEIAPALSLLGCLPVVLFFGIVTIPLALWLNRRLLEQKAFEPTRFMRLTLGRDRMILGKDAVEGAVHQYARDAIGTVGLFESERGAYGLAVEAHGDRNHLWLDNLGPRDLEWLAEQIRDWKRGR